MKEYEEIELKYPNLWFTSKNTFMKQLDYLINNDLYEDTRFELEEIQNSMKNYATPINFKKIYNKMIEMHYILITGNPGVGKTSLARALISYLMTKGNYKLIFTHSIQKLNRIYKVNEKQVFFIDDFWGSNFKENDYHGENEKALINFIKKIEKEENKILILTSRDYVLKQGIILNNEAEKVLYDNLYTLDLKDYDNKTKAEILMKKMLSYDIKYQYVDYIAWHAEKVIKHKNFNPRVLELYFSSGFDKETNEYEYYNYLIETLDFPIEFLDQMYKKQSKEARLILCILFTLKGPVLFKNIQVIYSRILDNLNIKDLTNCDMEKIVSQLEKNFIKTNYYKNSQIIVDFLNPSIRDYFYEFPEILNEFSGYLIKNFVYINQIEFFLNSNNQVFLEESGYQEEDIIKCLEDQFSDLKIARTYFEENALPFENLTNNEQFTFKLNTLINLDDKEQINKIILKEGNKLINSLKKGNREYIYFDELLGVIQIMEYISKFQETNWQEMIKLYYQNCKYAIELILIQEFKNIAPNEYNNFIKANRKQIDDKIIEFAYIDLEEYYINKQYESLSNLLFFLEDEYYYLYGKDAELKDCVDYYEGICEFDWLDDSETEENTKQDKNIYKYCTKELLNYPISMDENILRKNAADILTKEEIENLQEYIDNSGFLYVFTDNDENMLELINFYKEYKITILQISRFFQFFSYYLMKINGLDPRLFAKLVSIAFDSFYSNEKVFTEKTIGTIDEEMRRLIDSQMFIKNNKWIRFKNGLYQLYLIAFAISILDEDAKEKIYTDIIFALSPYNEGSFAFEDDMHFLENLLIEMDAEAFNKYFIKEYFTLFIKEINESKKDITSAIMDFFAMTIHLDDLTYKSITNFGHSFINTTTENLFQEMYKSPFEIFTEMSEEAFNEFKKILLNTDYHEIDLYKITDNPNFIKWLAKYKLDKEFLKLYQCAKIIIDNIDKHPFDSFEIWRDFIKNELIKQKSAVQS